MNKEYDARAATTANKLQLFQNKVEALKIAMGDKLLPTVTALAEKLGNFADRVSGWAERNPVLARTLMIMAVALGIMLVVFGGLAVVLGTIIAPFAMLSIVAGAFNLAMLPTFGIILAIVVVIGLLIAAAVLLYQNWDRIKAWFAGIWASVKAAAVAAVTWYLGLPAKFAEIGRNLLTGLINGFKSRLAALKNTITGAASSVAGWFRSKLGIHSPSRVFMGFGGHIMDGLAMGLNRGVDKPLARMAAAGRDLTRAAAVSVVATAPLASPALPRPPQAAQPNHVTIQVTQRAGESGEILRRVSRRCWTRATERPPPATAPPTATTRTPDARRAGPVRLRTRHHPLLRPVAPHRFSPRQVAAGGRARRLAVRRPGG